MKLRHGGDSTHLEHEGREIRVDGTDLLYLVRMTPMGRKVYYRNKAKQILRDRGADSEAEIMLQWCSLPAQEWAFGIPTETPLHEGRK